MWNSHGSDDRAPDRIDCGRTRARFCSFPNKQSGAHYISVFAPLITSSRGADFKVNVMLLYDCKKFSGRPFDVL